MYSLLHLGLDPIWPKVRRVRVLIALTLVYDLLNAIIRVAIEQIIYQCERNEYPHPPDFGPNGIKTKVQK